MRTFAQRLLLPGLTTLALAAAGCSSPAHTGSAGPGAAPGAPAAGGSQQLEVAAAPQGSADPTPLARTSTGEGRPEKSSLRVASYDKGSQRAVIAPAPKPPKGSQNSPSDGSPAPAKPVAVGDVIASAPAPGAPDGLLAK
ncbi:lipoprotein, partial [Streptomyces katrae]